MLSPKQVVPSSFRDPSGFLFRHEGTLLRNVAPAYRGHYDFLMNSGLYGTLTKRGLLISHEELSSAEALSGEAYKVIKPVEIPFISYPYEWCFSQLKDAALKTLEIQKTAFEAGMILKDASAYNIQFHEGRPLLIDTLSFEKYEEGKPWVAYRQFCQHFLAPLALMSLSDIRYNQLFRIYIDGIPLDFASKNLPGLSWLNFGLLSHIHLHAKSQAHFGGKQVTTAKARISRLGFQGIIESLENTVKKLGWKPAGTEWANYYEETNYSKESMTTKETLVGGFLNKTDAAVIWDLGANDGRFSRLAAEQNRLTASFDIDPAAVEKNYLNVKSSHEKNVIPLVQDLTNPSPSLGWSHRERMSLEERGPADAVLALALIHHIVIANNVPLENAAFYLSRLCKYLIIEFVPKEDSQVQKLLASRADIFPDYEPNGFENAFSGYFQIMEKSAIDDSKRTLYLMQSKGLLQ